VAHWKGKRVAAKRIMIGVHRSLIKASSRDWIVSNVATLRFVLRFRFIQLLMWTTSTTCL